MNEIVVTTGNFGDGEIVLVVFQIDLAFFQLVK